MTISGKKVIIATGVLFAGWAGMIVCEYLALKNINEETVYEEVADSETVKAEETKKIVKVIALGVTGLVLYIAAIIGFDALLPHEELFDIKLIEEVAEEIL